MVSIRSVHQSTRPAFNEWLSALQVSETTKKKLKNIIDNPDILLIGQEMVEILQDLHMDDETLQAALIYPYCDIHSISDEDIQQEFGEDIAQLISGVRKMDAIKTLQSRGENDHLQVEKLRNMLLSMVEDVRAVVIKMAERICTLHQVKEQDEELRVMVANECSKVYAPLANRLGIGQLKWELEDLSFRYLHPNTYKRIASMLKEKRSERQQYISDFVCQLQSILDNENINAQVIGRPKHIYSIYKKMQSKELTFEQLFDIRALRIVAKRLQDCYAALGVVHANFKHLPLEFDDYIATPKPNGYQSIHTVVIGPNDQSIEIQIRTEQMHEDAELGVAAHWRYKEGAKGKQAGADERVNWLRKILQWQEDMSESGSLIEEFKSQVFEDRVYVLTPKGDVVDLPKGATPLDFAYYVHSNVGHKCTGAKINDRIVPFTYLLQTGDQVSVLTNKNAAPSRDWVHPGLGYVHTARARAAINSYFKKQDKEKNCEAGKELLERELNKHNISIKHASELVEKYNVKTLDDLYAAIGTGDVRIMAVVNTLQQKYAPAPELPLELPKRQKRKASKSGQPIIAEGVGNLLSNLANCCQPVSGDEIIGYITLGKGVSVHKASCPQLENLLKNNPEREIEVAWADDSESKAFITTLDVHCDDRDGILRDLTTELANEKVNLLGVMSVSNTKNNTASIRLTVEVSNTSTLNKLILRVRNVRGVYDIVRQ